MGVFSDIQWQIYKTLTIIWSDLAEIQTPLRYYVCPQYLLVNFRDINQRVQRLSVQFFRILEIIFFLLVVHICDLLIYVT